MCLQHAKLCVLARGTLFGLIATPVDIMSPLFHVVEFLLRVSANVVLVSAAVVIYPGSLESAKSVVYEAEVVGATSMLRAPCQGYNS